MLVIFSFVAGLAFFAMGLAIAVEAFRPSAFPWAEHLSFLAWFAFLRSISSWVEVGEALLEQPASITYGPYLEAAKALLMALSALFLLEYAVRSILAIRPCCRWLRWLTPALIFVWLLGLILLRDIGPHVGPFLLSARVMTWYWLYLPGLVLSSLVAFLSCQSLRDAGSPALLKDCRQIGIAFGFKAVFAGLVVPPAPFPPASLLNEHTFLATTGLPAQLFYTVPVVVIARSVIHMLRGFEREQKRSLDKMNRRHLKAQQQALVVEQRAHEEVMKWSRQLEDVLDIVTAALSKAVNRQEMLDLLIHKIVDWSRFELGAIFLVDQHTGERLLAAHCGVCRYSGLGLDRAKLFEQILARGANSQEVVVIDCPTSGPQDLSDMQQPSSPSLQIGVPLRSRGTVLGLLCLCGQNRGSLTSREQRVLLSLGQQIGSGIEIARLHQQVHRLAALEEQRRLARELHDSLAQELGYLNVQACLVETLLAGDNVEQARACLVQLKAVIGGCYSDVRGEMSNLRAASLDLPLPELLERHVAAYRERYGVDVHLERPGECVTGVPVEAKPQIVRIVQEALTNARKHAGASRVRVSLEQGQGDVSILVEDNGRGFEPDRCAGGGEGEIHLGLQVMRERATSVGGALEIDSQPAGGTRVRLRVPCSARE